MDLDEDNDDEFQMLNDEEGSENSFAMNTSLNGDDDKFKKQVMTPIKINAEMMKLSGETEN